MKRYLLYILVVFCVISCVQTEDSKQQTDISADESGSISDDTNTLIVSSDTTKDIVKPEVQVKPVKRKPVVIEEEEEEEEEIFIVVEDMPRFMNSDRTNFCNYVVMHLRYPAIASENGISGKVYVQFTVNTEGIVEEASVIRGVDPVLDREALRVVRSSPKWMPGRQRGKPVCVKFVVPVNFVLL